jgi:hypothetical protein
MGLFNPHPGSWSVGGFKLPDFGVTEMFSGGNRTASGGSNLWSGNQASTGQVLGDQSLPEFEQQSPYTYGGGAVTTGGGGGGTGGGDTGGGGTTNPDGSAEMSLIDQIYGGTINDLNNQAGTAQSNYGSIQGDINTQYNNSAGNLQTNLNQSNAGLDLTAQQGEKRQVDALSAARRLYNDLVQGGQQRFGGASSAGEAYQALTGRQLQQNNQAISSQFNDFMGQVGLARTNIKSKYDTAIKDLETQKNLAFSQAQRDFQNTMSQINSMKNEAGTNKATNQLAALQQLRNQIYNINIASVQNSQALNDLRTQAESGLQDAITNFTGQTGNAANAGTAYSQNTTTNPTSALAFGDTGGGSRGFAQTGQINPDEDRKKEWYDAPSFA